MSTRTRRPVDWSNVAAVLGATVISAGLTIVGGNQVLGAKMEATGSRLDKVVADGETEREARVAQAQTLRVEIARVDTSSQLRRQDSRAEMLQLDALRQRELDTVKQDVRELRSGAHR